MACDHRPGAELRRRPSLLLALGAVLVTGLACSGGGGGPNVGAPRLTGTVRDVTGAPVGGVTLRLTQEGAVTAETTSAADGSFTFAPRPGEYVLTPSATDAVFSPETSRVSADWDTARTVDFLAAHLTFVAIPVTDVVGVEDLTVGGDGALWLTEETAGALSRLTTDGSGYTAYAMPSPPFAVTTDVTGRVWFTMRGGASSLRLGYVKGDGTPTTLGLLPSAADPTNIVAGTGGEVWVMENGIGKIARVIPGSGSTLVLTEYPMLTSSWGWTYDLALDPSGSVWYTDTIKPQIGRVTPGSPATTFPINSADAVGIVAAGGAIWFSCHDLNAIVRMGLDGTVTGTFTLPTPNAGPERIVVGKDGALWFPELAAGKIGRLTTDGAIAEFAIPGASKLRSITADPDPSGGVWFSDHGVNRIGHLR